MENLKKFWEAANFPEDTLNKLLAEVDPEDGENQIDPTEVATEFTGTLKSLYTKDVDTITEDDVKQRFNVYDKKIMSMVNKTIGLGLSRSELDKLEGGVEKVFELAKNQYNTKIQEASETTDKDLLTKIRNLEGEAVDLKSELHDWQNKYEEEVEKITKKAEGQITQHIVEALLDDELDKKDFAFPSAAHRDKQWIKNQIKSRFKIDRDGSITMPDGSRAVNFSNNGHYSKVQEAIDYLFDTEGMGAKSRGAVIEKNKIGSKVVKENLSGRAKEMQARRNKYERVI